jgi:hypothetical protein
VGVPKLNKDQMSLRPALIVVLLIFWPPSTSADAAEVTETFAYSTSFNAPAPFSTLAGNFTLTFDPAVTYNTDTTSGLILNSITPSVFGDNGVGFQYYPENSGGQMVFGGLQSGVNEVVGGTTDFWVEFYGIQDSPVFGEMVYVVADNSNAGFSSNGTLAVSVPEPASAGLLGLAPLYLRRRRR